MQVVLLLGHAIGLTLTFKIKPLQKHLFGFTGAQTKRENSFYTVGSATMAGSSSSTVIASCKSSSIKLNNFYSAL